MEKLKVRVQCERVVHFDQVVEMTKEEFNRVSVSEDISERNDSIKFGILDSKIDTSDIFTMDSEFTSVEVSLEDEDGD